MRPTTAEPIPTAAAPTGISRKGAATVPAFDTLVATLCAPAGTARRRRNAVVNAENVLICLLLLQDGKSADRCSDTRRVHMVNVNAVGDVHPVARYEVPSLLAVVDGGT